MAEIARTDRSAERIDWIRSIPFFAMHLACGLAWWAGVSWIAVLTAVTLYFVRMFGITGGYHRYFAHASFKTSRPFQFVLAWIGCASMQKGPLWWASLHRHHHAHSDEEEDIHSPLRRGFLWSHMGWILCRKHEETLWNLVKGLSRYRELVWLNRHHHIPGLSLAAGTLAFGWLLERYAPGLGTNAFQMLVWGFFISTVLLYHGTFTINSLAHVIGRRRFPTKDGSRNNFLLALITLGEGWHNNHHYAPSLARMGFRWYEIDISHWILTVLARLGLVWDLKLPPRHLLSGASSSAPAAS